MILVTNKEFDRTVLLLELFTEINRQCLYRFLWRRLVPEEQVQWRIVEENL